MIKCNTHTTTQKNKIKNNLFEKKLFQLWTHFHFCKKVFLLTFVMRVTCNKWKKLPWTFAQSTEYLGFFYMRSCANPIQEENHFFPSKHWVESGGLRDWHFIWIDRNPPSWWMTANSWLLGNICFDWWVTVLESWWWQIWGKGVTCCQTIIDRFVTFVYFSITQIQGEELVMKFHWSAVFA